MPGRDYFFYGLLMDEDVLGKVIGRTIPPALLLPACVEGYRRVIVAGATYPMLVPDDGTRVEGRLMEKVDPPAAARLAAFEGRERYGVVELEILVKSRRRVKALTFMARQGTRPSAEDWDPAVWRRLEKRTYVG